MADHVKPPPYIPPLATGGRLWGAERVRIGLSIRELSRRSGVDKAYLSLYENGRMVPSSDEFDRIMAVLREAEKESGG